MDRPKVQGGAEGRARAAGHAGVWEDAMSGMLGLIGGADESSPRLATERFLKAVFDQCWPALTGHSSRLHPSLINRMKI